MELEEFIKQKAWGIHRKKLDSVCSNFELMLPSNKGWDGRVFNSEDLKEHADSHGSNILTDTFGLDFCQGQGFSKPKDLARVFVDILILAYGIDVKSSLFSPEYTRKCDLADIKEKIMNQMQSAIPDDEPETSITIKGKGIKVDA